MTDQNNNKTIEEKIEYISIFFICVFNLIVLKGIIKTQSLSQNIIILVLG